MDMDEKTQTFDVDEWRRQGTIAHDKCEQDIRALEEELSELRLRKTELGKALGLVQEKESGKAPRVKIRPKLLAILEENAGQEMDLDAVFEILKKDVPHVQKKAFQDASVRLSKTEEAVTMLPGAKILFTEPE